MRTLSGDVLRSKNFYIIHSGGGEGRTPAAVCTRTRFPLRIREVPGSSSEQACTTYIFELVIISKGGEQEECATGRYRPYKNARACCNSHFDGKGVGISKRQSCSAEALGKRRVGRRRVGSSRSIEEEIEPRVASFDARDIDRNTIVKRSSAAHAGLHRSLRMIAATTEASTRQSAENRW